jgi:hypothetical protein
LAGKVRSMRRLEYRLGRGAGYLSQTVLTMRLGKREFSPILVIAGVSVFLLAVSLLLLFRSEKQVKIYNKEFRVLDVEYNHATVISSKRFKEKVILLLARLGTPQRVLNKLREPQRSQIFSVGTSGYGATPAPDTVRIYFKWPYDGLIADLVDERGKKIPLRTHLWGTSPSRNEKDIMWDVPRGRTDSNSVYTLRIIRSVETNAVTLADIKLGRLRN